MTAMETSQQASNGPKIAIVMPTYNDWPNIVTLLPKIDRVLQDAAIHADVFIVDDASINISRRDEVASLSLSAIREVYALELTRNFGSQRAVAVGIGYVADQVECDYLVVMDSDHEDKPEYIPDLIDECSKPNSGVVFAERTKRSEGLLFRMFYFLYKLIFHVLTGTSLSFGNYSVISGPLICRVAAMSELWDHYSSAIMRARIPHTMIASSRGSRYSGKSAMNLAALVAHGLNGLAVHADIVSARILIAMGLLSLVIIFGAGLTFLLRLTTDILLIGQASQFLGLLLIIFLQVAVMVTLLVLVALVSRSRQTSVPLRDYSLFVVRTTRLLPYRNVRVTGKI
jgi:glycosyltransferase involved in cell wall biosynthesis